MYAIVAQLVHVRPDGWTVSVGVPTFYLNESVQGIVSAEHAEQIALKVILPVPIEGVTAHITAVRVD